MSPFVQSARGAAYYTPENDTLSASFLERELISPSFMRPSTEPWNEVIDELLMARTLTDDWDGQGSPAPSQEVVDTALKLVLHLQKLGCRLPDDFGPTVNGCISLGWHSGPKSMLLEVTANLRIQVYHWSKGDERAKKTVLIVDQ